MRRAVLVVLLPVVWVACEDGDPLVVGPSLSLDAGSVTLPDAAVSGLDASIAAETITDAASTEQVDAADAATVDAGPNPVSVSALTGTTAEDGTGFDLVVSLARAPTDIVTIPITISKPGEATATPGSLTFTPAGGLTASLAIRGVDDGVDDANQPFTITIGPPASADPSFANHPALVVDATNESWVQRFANIGFDVAAGTTVDLDNAAAWPVDYQTNGGWVGSPNPPYDTVIGDTFGRNGRGAKLTRPAGTDGTYLPGFQQTLAVADTERTCVYRARADVEAIDDTARLRLLLDLDYANGVHANIGYVDSTAATGTWQTLSVQETGPAVAWTNATVIVGAATAGYTGEARADNVRLDRICK